MMKPAQPPCKPGRESEDIDTAAEHALWAVLGATLKMHGEQLARHAGVVGTGLAYRRRGGRVTSEGCLTVYVERKRTLPELRRARIPAVPTWLQPAPGLRVPVDVVEVGVLTHHVACGARLGSRGLGIGDHWGTLGMVATDRATGRPVALTSMHITGRLRHPPGEPLRFTTFDQAEGRAVPLGLLVAGTTEGVDAAKISIDPPTRVVNSLPGIGRLRPPRAICDADLRRPVHLYGARSQYQAGFITDVYADFPRDGLSGAFLVSMTCAHGDSGAVCCDLRGTVLGLHVGSLTGVPRTQVFCPIQRVLSALDCEP
jgi:hypothetical protein